MGTSFKDIFSNGVLSTLQTVPAIFPAQKRILNWSSTDKGKSDAAAIVKIFTDHTRKQADASKQQFGAMVLLRLFLFR